MSQREREAYERDLLRRQAEIVKRPVGYAEMLAIDPTVIRRGSDFFFLDMGGWTPGNERVGDVAIVHVRGSLEHHATWCGNSYEDLAARLECAFAGDEGGQEWDLRERWGYAEGPRPDAVPPKAVIMCVDSRGGVVAGLNETIAAIQKMRADAGIPLVAYVNEMAASAAYALCCATDRVLAPASAILGSIGTISTMVSCAERDRADGIDVRLITSGARKADGHPHAPITKEAEAAERARVDALAAEFFKIVSKARGISIDKVRSFQAAIFLGTDAKRVGLADEVASLDDVVASYGATPSGPSANGNETDRRAALDKTALRASVSTVPSSGDAPGASMNIDEMIAKTEAALAAATDPAKQERLSSRLASFKLTKLRAEKPDDDGDEDDDDEAGKHAKKAAEHKAKSESEKHKAKAAEFRQKAAEADEKAKAAEGGDEEEEAEESKAALALIQQHTGLTGAAAIGSAAAMFGQVAEHDKAIKAMQAKAVADERASLVASVSKMTTKAEREMLADWPLKQVRSFVETRMKSGLVHTEDSSLVKAKVIVPGSEDSLTPEALAMIDIACQHFPGTEAERTEFRKAQVAAHTAAHQKALAPALNGAAGRL